MRQGADAAGRAEIANFVVKDKKSNSLMNFIFAKALLTVATLQ